MWYRNDLKGMWKTVDWVGRPRKQKTTLRDRFCLVDLVRNNLHPLIDEQRRWKAIIGQQYRVHRR